MPNAKAIAKLVAGMRASAKSVRFTDAVKVAEHYFGPARSSATSHHVFKTPWQGDPRVNLQPDKGKAKAYQVQQLLAAIDRIEGEKDNG
jgi:hypothetical protein